MTPIVVDASFVAAAVLRSQRTEAAWRIVEDWTEYRAIAPYVLALETPWLLLKQERRTGQRGLAGEAVRTFERFGIELASPLDQTDLWDALTLSLELNMGFYDVMYLMLAEEETAALVSRDARLLDVALKFGVSVIDVR